MIPDQAATKQIGMKAIIALLIVVFVALQYLLWLGDHGAIRLWQLDRAIQAQSEENDRLRQRNQKLHAEVVDLKHGSEALEERARSQLGMIKKGETFYQIIEPEPGADDPQR